MAGWTTLVQPEILAVALAREDLVVVDCRFSLLDNAAGERSYAESHIPGAVYMHLERDLSDMRVTGGGRHPWPEERHVLARLGEVGIAPHHQVVAYDDGDLMFAPRLWFMLRTLGHEKVAVLDGGWKRWTSLGLPTASARELRASTYYPGSFDRERLVDAAGVQAHLDGGGLLIDSRAGDRFRGMNESIDRIAGHVPGAVNRPFADNLADGRMKPPTELADAFRGLRSGRTPGDVVVMCGSGVSACANLLAMERAGLRGARLYAGSWSDWITDPARPVASGDA